MHTDPLTASRYPDSSDSPNVAQYIQNAVIDLSDNVITGPYATATARDSAFGAWVALGNSMRNGLRCYVTGTGSQIYVGGTWLNESYYNAGTNAGTALTASPVAPSGGAAISVPAGTYDIDVRAYFSLSTASPNTQILTYVYNGSTQLFETDFYVLATGGVSSRAHSDFTRLTVASAATLSLRFATGTTGGTQSVSANSIRARTVS